MYSKTLDAIKQHAEQEFPRECCGLITIRKGKELYVPCTNKAEKNEHFVLGGEEYAEVEDQGEIVAIVHSHCNVPAIPSEADLVGCERSGLPWVIYSLPNHQVHEFKPNGYKSGLIGREFSHGVLDCYTLIQDYYKDVLDIELADFNRQDEWWLKGANLYLENSDEQGFVKVSDLKEHDVILMQMSSPVPNHGAIYLGEGIILQHLTNRLSGRDVYGGWFEKITAGIYRHKSLC